MPTVSTRPIANTLRESKNLAEADIYAVLTGVTALGSRIYPLKLPQDVAYPAVVYQRLSTTRYPAFSRDAKPVSPVIQVDVYGHESAGYSAFWDTADAVRMALQRHRGGAILDTFIDAERSDYEENTQLFRTSFDIRPWFRET